MSFTFSFAPADYFRQPMITAHARVRLHGPTFGMVNNISLYWSGVVSQCHYVLLVMDGIPVVVAN